MPRIRTIKPDFFFDEDLAQLSPQARLFFIGLWTQADREGRGEDRPAMLKARIFPYEKVDGEALMAELHPRFVLRYSVSDSRPYFWIRTFLKHQLPHYKEMPSLIPPPDGIAPSLYIAVPVTAEDREAVMKRDGCKCLTCGALKDLTIDHIIPRSKGGTSEKSNLQVLCRSCNASKSNNEAMSNRHQPILTQHRLQEGKGREGKGNEIGREGNNDSCAEPQAATAPPVLAFPVVGGKYKAWGLTQEAADGLRAAFPDMDVRAEARKALAWIEANPGRRKTPRGMPRFLYGWMERAQNGGRHGASGANSQGRGGDAGKRIVGYAAPVPGKYSKLG